MHSKAKIQNKNLLIQDTIREGGTGADTEKVTVNAGGVVIHVVQLRAGLVPTSDHRAHAQTVTAVLVPAENI